MIHFSAATLAGIALVLSPVIMKSSESEWDWKAATYFKAYYSPDASRPREIEIKSPFHQFGSGLYHSDPSHADMWESDGWLLIQRNFGTPDRGPEYPNFVMYNKYH